MRWLRGGQRANERTQLQARVSQEADRGRRLAIYDQRTGLLSLWYFKLRLEEECQRCNRYDLSLALARIQAVGETSEKFQEWTKLQSSTAISALRPKLRNTDLAASISQQEIVICLIQSGLKEASLALRRLLDDAGEAQWRVGLAVYPDDDERGDLLDTAAERFAPWKTGEQLRRAA